MPTCINLIMAYKLRDRQHFLTKLNHNLSKHESIPSHSC